MFVILLIVILICVLLLILYKINPVQIAADLTNYDILLQQNSQPKLNCNTQIVYALDDVVCNNVCVDNGSFIAQHGFCVNELAAIEIPSINKCEAKDGVLAYYVGDEALGTANFLCLSVDLGIQPDDISKTNLMCANGTISINYLTRFPQISDCKCNSNNIAVLIKGTSETRDYVVCASKNLKVYTDGTGLTST